MRRPLEFFVQSARSRKGLAAAALIASSLLIALAVVHNATRRTALAAVYPPFASSFGARARARCRRVLVHAEIERKLDACGKARA